MATEGSLRARWGAYLFAAAGLAFLARLWALRYAGLNLDECSFIVVAGLVAKGAKLYGDTLCQHMPLDVIAIHPLAALGLSKDPAPYRLLVALVQLAAAAALAASPAFQGKRAWAWSAGIVYLFLYAGLATATKGHVYSSYSIAGAAWVVSFSMLGLPLALGLAPSRLQAFVGASAYAVWALSSPALVFASVLYLAACASAPGMTAKNWVAALAGGIFVLLLQLGWMWRYGDFVAWYEQVIVFNAKVYPALNREPGANSLLLASLTDALASVRRLGLGGWLILALPIALLGHLAQRPAKRLWAPAGLLLASFLLLRVRHYFWKGLPFDCASFAGLGVAAFLLIDPARATFRRGAFALAALLGALLFYAVLTTAKANPIGDYWYAGSAGRMQADFAELRGRAPSGSTLLAIPNNPHYFMLTGMPPAYGLLAYGPIPAFFDFPAGGVPRRGNLCEKLFQEARPALIYDRRDVSMYYYDVAEVTPPCVDAFEAANYARIAWKNWWVRKDLAGLFKHLPQQPGPPWSEEVP